MSRLLHFVFLALVTVAVTKTFLKYRNMALFDTTAQERIIREKADKRLEWYKEEYMRLKAKSVELDADVDTNEKLMFITHSDNFEEALFLLDYIGDRFRETSIAGPDQLEIAVADIGFYLKRLNENLLQVEKGLGKLESPEIRVTQR